MSGNTDSVAGKWEEADADEPKTNPFGEGALEQLFADSARTRMVRFLAENAGATFRQATVAERTGLSEPMISRTKTDLVDLGIVDETEDGISLNTEVTEAFIGLMEKLEDLS